MTDLYIIILASILIALFIGFMAVTIYLGWVLIQHDLDEKRKGDGDGKTRRD